jgi:hypothetical protein
MPSHLKQMVRARMVKTGERYQTALRHVRAQGGDSETALAPSLLVEGVLPPVSSGNLAVAQTGPAQARVPKYILFDNSALNQLFGQSKGIDESMRRGVIERVSRDVTAGALVVVINLALLGEVAGLCLSKKEDRRDRFRSIVDFLFNVGDGRIMRPLDQQDLLVRFALEVEACGKAPHERLFRTGRDIRWIREAFLGAKRDSLEKIARDAKQRKDTFSREERERRPEVEKRLQEIGGKWDDEFPNWPTDPQADVDEWARYEMQRHPKSYCLPEDRASWPKPRELPTLWYARAYHAARLKEIGEGRKCDERGDLYDGIYFQDSAYVDILVTDDEAILRRAKAVRLTQPRFLGIEEWVAEVLNADGGGAGPAT